MWACVTLYAGKSCIGPTLGDPWAAPCPESLADAGNHDCRPVAEKLTADSDDDPAAGGQFRVTVDVSGPLRRIGPVLRTVELHTDPPLRPPHIDAGKRIPEAVAHHDLRLRFSQPRADEQEPRPAFLGRLGSAVHQLDHAPQLNQTSRTRMTRGDGPDGCGAQPSYIGQRV